jgi:parallel beta-helix repeat protein
MASTRTRGAAARGLLVALLVSGAVAAAPGAAPAAEVAVTISDNFFSPQELHVDPGDTVTWTQAGTRIHDVTSDTGDFLSGDMQRGSRFSHTFREEGTYYYHCSFHGRGGKVGMWGVVVVGDPKPPGDDGGKEERPRIDVPADFRTIQAAVDAAEPGSTIVVAPGTYRGGVRIETDDLIVRGVDRFRTVLDGAGRRPHGVLVDGADAVTIANLTVRDFADSGIGFLDSTRYTAARIDAIANRAYGIHASGSYDGVVSESFGWGSGAAAFHVGECMGCGTLLDGVRAERSYAGYLGTNATGVTVRRSAWVGNAAGIVSISTAGSAHAPGRGTLVFDNLVAGNDYADAPRAGETDAVPVPVGTGIWLAGVESNAVRDNTVSSHARFGIVVTESGGHVPSGNTVLHNEVAGAGLFALAWDGSGADTCFSRNDFTGETGPPDVEGMYACAARPFEGTPFPRVTEAVAAAIAEGAARAGGSPPDPERPRCQKGRPGCPRRRA